MKRLEIYYNGGQAIFAFNNTKDTDKWARNIIKLISSDTSNFETLGDSSLFGADVLAETFKDTFDTFKAGLGVKDAEPERFQPSVAFVEHLCQVK